MANIGHSYQEFINRLIRLSMKDVEKEKVLGKRDID
jgi:hypothetical protein